MPKSLVFFPNGTQLEFVPQFSHSLRKHLLGAYYMLVTTLGSRNTKLSSHRTDKLVMNDGKQPNRYKICQYDYCTMTVISFNIYNEIKQLQKLNG